MVAAVLVECLVSYNRVRARAGRGSPSPCPPLPPRLFTDVRWCLFVAPVNARAAPHRHAATKYRHACNDDDDDDEGAPRHLELRRRARALPLSRSICHRRGWEGGGEGGPFGRDSVSVRIDSLELENRFTSTNESVNVNVCVR